MKSPSEKIIVALDVPTADRAMALVDELSGKVGAFKVGLQLFTAEGRPLVERLVAAGAKVFLDLKFHDIPNTVAMACVEAAKLGVWMFNVHAGGGSEMMRRSMDSLSEWSEREGRPRPIVLGVTVLTSSNAETLRETGVGDDVEAQVIRLARLTQEAGLDGVVASANEIAPIRAGVESPRFAIVTPGIRPKNATRGDQKRVMTPASALEAGADFLVIGRPITEADNPSEAVSEILAEMGSAQH